MFRTFCRFLLLWIGLMVYSCMPNTYSSKPKPITISARKAREIQTRSRHVHEVKRFNNDIVRWDIIRRNQLRGRNAREHRRYSVNNNSKNRRSNYKAVARKRKQDNNYRYYRESLEANQQNERSSFSIYDK